MKKVFTMTEDEVNELRVCISEIEYYTKQTEPNYVASCITSYIERAKRVLIMEDIK